MQTVLLAELDEARVNLTEAQAAGDAVGIKKWMHAVVDLKVAYERGRQSRSAPGNDAVGDRASLRLLAPIVNTPLLDGAARILPPADSLSRPGDFSLPSSYRLSLAGSTVAPPPSPPRFGGFMRPGTPLPGLFLTRRRRRSVSAPHSVALGTAEPPRPVGPFEHMFGSGYRGGTGSNRRYAHQYDKLMERRVTEVLIHPKTIGLTDAELDIDNDPVVTPTQPVTARAWARYPETSARVEGRAIAWTSRAVKIERTDAQGAVQQTWVWSSAVDKI